MRSVFLLLSDLHHSSLLQYLESFSNALWNNNLVRNLKDSNPKEEFVTGDCKGTGIFQTELNKGSLAVISDDIQYAKDDLFIRDEYCGRGIGSWALNQLFKHDTLQMCLILPPNLHLYAEDNL